MKIMKLTLASALLSLALAGQGGATDSGTKDVLRLHGAVQQNGDLVVAVHVINQKPLAALDIPLCYGQPGDPIELVRVDFSDRVSGWDFKHAQIDAAECTVVLGLISELVGVRVDADLKTAASSDTKIADLVFKAAPDYTPELSAFKSEHPGHELTFLFNEADALGRPVVQEITPALETELDFKAGTRPEAYALSQNFPNPFNPSTSFALSLPEASDYDVAIFNIAGQRVKSISGHLEAGTHTILWEGDNDQGQKVASGVYFFRATAGSFSQTRKMTMLK